MLMKNSSDVDRLHLHWDYLFEKNVNFKDRIITLAEEVSPTMFLKLDAALTEMESHNRKAVTIKLLSDGGNVDAAIAIVGRIRSAKCKIIVEAYGYIQSSATLILASGHFRKISRYAEFMYHESSYGIGHDDSNRNTFKHSEVGDKWQSEERLEARWAEHMASFSKKSKKFWKGVGCRKDAWFNPEQLLRMGVVDEIF